MLENIMKDNYVAMRMDDPDTDGYDIAEQDSNVYTAQDEIVMKGYNPSKYTYIGEMVYKARGWNPMSKEKY